jgi:hypothetical protein
MDLGIGLAPVKHLLLCLLEDLVAGGTALGTKDEEKARSPLKAGPAIATFVNARSAGTRVPAKDKVDY